MLLELIRREIRRTSVILLGVTQNVERLEVDDIDDCIRARITITGNVAPVYTQKI